MGKFMTGLHLPRSKSLYYVVKPVADIGFEVLIREICVSKMKVLFEMQLDSQLHNMKAKLPILTTELKNELELKEGGVYQFFADKHIKI
jgi:hypothetical protein